MQLDVHADDGGQRKEVVRANSVGIPIGPDMRQVKDLKRELASVSSEGISDYEIEYNWTRIFLLSNCKAAGSG